MEREVCTLLLDGVQGICLTSLAAIWMNALPPPIFFIWKSFKARNNFNSNNYNSGVFDDDSSY
jgi:hypothetical protein